MFGITALAFWCPRALGELSHAAVVPRWNMEMLFPFGCVLIHKLFAEDYIYMVAHDVREVGHVVLSSYQPHMHPSLVFTTKKPLCNAVSVQIYHFVCICSYELIDKH